MRVGEKIWHCKRISKSNAEFPEFELPYKITTRLGYLTVQPSTRAYSENGLFPYGEDIKQYQTIIAQPYEKWYQVFSEGDRLYLDGKTPSEEDLEDIYAENANYIVDSVRNQNRAICIIVKKRTAE